MRFLQAYGLQRTGTNALKALVETNHTGLRVYTHRLGSKHEPPTPAATSRTDLAYLISIKDPVTWVCSYWRWRAAKALDETPPRIYDPLPYQLPSWLTVWDQRTTAWLDLATTRPAVVVQHEHLLRHPGAVLDETTTTLDLTRRPGPPDLLLDGVARRGAETDHGRALLDPTRTIDRAHHLEGRWAHDIPPVAIDQAAAWFTTWLDQHPHHAARFDLHHMEGHTPCASTAR